MLENGIKIKGHVGKWYVIDKTFYKGKVVCLLEHETYGDEAACLIVDENLNIIQDEVWNGFDDLEYESPSQNMPCDNHGMLACTESCPKYFECHK